MIFEFAFGTLAILATMAILTFVAESDLVGGILAFFDNDGE